MRDIFNGNIKNIKEAYTVIFLEILIFLLCAAVFILVGALYNNFEEGARGLTIALGILSFVCSIAFPVATISFTRKYPKHKKLCHLLLKPCLFVDKS